MSVADQTVPLASLAGRVPFTVRFSPQFVNRMFDRLQRSVPAQANIAGLLFGRMDQEVNEVQVFRSIPDADGRPNLSVPLEQLSETVERLIASSRKDPEVSALSLLGWYSFRATGGLHESDVAFHNHFFRQPNEIALILRPEQHPDVLFEIYSKSGTTLLSEDEHRWGSLRMSSSNTVLGPIDVAMRSKIGDDFYLRAYQVSKKLDRAERREHWASALEATKSTVRSLFRQKRKESYTRDPGAERDYAGVAPEAGPPATALARAVAAAAADPPIFNRPARQESFSAAPPPVYPPPFKSPPASPPLPRESRNDVLAPARDPVALQRIVAGDPPALPAVIKPPKRGVPWLSSVIVFAVAAGATFALYVQGFASSGDTPHFLRAIFPDTGLGLRVEGQGDRVLLSWNRRNALVRSSRGGVLHIDDGLQHRDVRLDGAQIANGSVLYRPGSDDVSFRLEVHGTEGAAIAETTRVLDGAKVEPLEVKNLPTDVSPAAPIAAPPSATPATPTSDPYVRHDDYLTPPVATRPAYTPPSHAPTSVAKPVSQPEHHPSPSGDTAPLTSAPPVPAPFPPLRTEPSVPNTAGTATTSKPAQTSAAPGVTPTEQRSSLPPAQTTTETTKPSVPVPAPDAVHQPDTSKVSNWEDVPSAAKPVEAPPGRTSPPLAPDSSPARPTADTRPAPTFVPPKPLRQILPDLRGMTPSLVGNTSQLEVAVRVSKKGHVTEAYLVGDASKVAPRLARAALSAAKQWTFQPATIRGKSVASDHTIVFEFRPSNH